MKHLKLIDRRNLTLKDCELLMKMGYTVECNDGEISDIWRKGR